LHYYFIIVLIRKHSNQHWVTILLNMHIANTTYLHLLKKAKTTAGIDESALLKHAFVRDKLCNSINQKLSLRGEDFLSADTLKNQRLKANNAATISISHKYLEPLLEYCGYKNLKEVETELDSLFPIVELLKNFEGFWYSYVRKNTKGNTVLLVAPVWLRNPVETGIEMILKPPERNGKPFLYKGFLQLVNVCLVGTLTSTGSKQISKFIKIGNGKPSTVLQGIFATINANNDPIAGREVLIKSNEVNYKGLETNEDKTNYFEKLKHSVKSANDNLVSPELQQYFKTYQNNNLKTKYSNGELSDLLD